MPDLYDLYDLARAAGWEPCLYPAGSTVAHVFWVG